MLEKQTILQNQKTINYLCGEWLLVNEKKKMILIVGLNENQ